jgi:hypothetical protein
MMAVLQPSIVRRTTFARLITMSVKRQHIQTLTTVYVATDWTEVHAARITRNHARRRSNEASAGSVPWRILGAELANDNAFMNALVRHPSPLRRRSL